MFRKKYWRFVTGAVFVLLAVIFAIHDYITYHGSSAVPAEFSPEPTTINQESAPILGDDSHDDSCMLDGHPCPVDETLTVQSGDTLSSVLSRAEIDLNQATEVIEQLRKVFNPKDLRPQHEVAIKYSPAKDSTSKRQLLSLYIRPSIDVGIYVDHQESGGFIARSEKKELSHITRFAKGTILNSLYIDAGKQAVPPKILHELIQAFSYDVDFQRGFHTGDLFGVMYDIYADPQSLREQAGQLHFAMLQLQDKHYRIYRFKNTQGHYGFYNEKGESVKKGLLRTPIDGARISSPFGNRHHPILGFTKKHMGIDFAAPTGTPIMAAGDGVVIKAEFFSSYGRYILVRHNQEFSTAYAHMSRFAKGVHAGSRVRQGQIIGYVGASGRATGAHLHYELHRNGKQINPNSIKMLPAGKLTGHELSDFKSKVAHVNREFENYKPPVEIEAPSNEDNVDGTPAVNDDVKELETNQDKPITNDAEVKKSY